MQQFFCQIETNMSGIKSRQVFIVGQMPQGEKPPLFEKPYRGVPQFDLADLDTLRETNGPQPYMSGRIYAPPHGHADLPQIPKRERPYDTGLFEDPQPYPLTISGAPVEGLEDDYRAPLPGSVRPRLDPSR